MWVLMRQVPLIPSINSLPGSSFRQILYNIRVYYVKVFALNVDGEKFRVFIMFELYRSVNTNI